MKTRENVEGTDNKEVFFFFFFCIQQPGMQRQMENAIPRLEKTSAISPQKGRLWT